MIDEFGEVRKLVDDRWTLESKNHLQSSTNIKYKTPKNQKGTSSYGCALLVAGLGFEPRTFGL